MVQVNEREPPQVLLSVSDELTRQRVIDQLCSAGFIPVVAPEIAGLLELNKTDLFDLVILSPELERIESCCLIRSVSLIPILFIGSNADEQRILACFEAGADDFYCGPLQSWAFLSRLQAIMKCFMYRAPMTQRHLQYEDLVVDLIRRQVVQNGQVVQLTPLEFSILHYLILHQGEAVTQDELLREAWGNIEIAGNANLVAAAIKRLRKKLGDPARQPRYIFTLWGRGYRLGQL